jgi:hypothetical protein
MIRRLIIALACCLVSGEAFAQAAVLPYGVTGQTATGQLVTAPNPANFAGSPLADNTSILPSYASSASFAATTGVLFAACGSATKVLVIRSLLIGGTATTAGFQVMNLIKTSTDPSAGTAVTPTPADANDAAATGTASYYTSAPTAGTPVGTSDVFPLGFPATAAIAGTQLFATLTPAPGRKPIILRGTSQCLEVQTSSAALTGESLQITLTWTEGTTAP